VSPAAWCAVALIGGCAAVARFQLDTSVRRRTRGPFPFGTLAVNLSGTLALGLLTGLALSGEALVLAGSAALGSYTTFSTWMLDSRRLAAEGRTGLAALDVALSLAAGVTAAALGRLLGARL
jgi:fluoride exporter